MQLKSDEEFSMFISKLEERILSDLNFDYDKNVEKFLNNMSKLSTQYRILLGRYTKEFLVLEEYLDEIYKTLFKYYLEESDIKLTRDELKIWIKQDKSYKEVKSNMRNIKHICELCEGAIKDLDSLGWNIQRLTTYRTAVAI